MVNYFNMCNFRDTVTIYKGSGYTSTYTLLTFSACDFVTGDPSVKFDLDGAPAATIKVVKFMGCLFWTTNDCIQVDNDANLTVDDVLFHGNHFLAAIRRNIDVTLLVHNNQVYGLTKGQASPTTDEGFVTKAQPEGVASAPFNAVAVAVTLQAGFVARGFSGMVDHLSDLIQRAIARRGFSLIDVLQPCVSFNKINTYAWYKERCHALPQDYDPTAWETAMKVAAEWGDRIPVGVIYRNERPSFGDRLGRGRLVGHDVDRERIRKIAESFS